MRRPTRRLPPSPAGTAGRTQVEQMDLDAFADRLQEARTAMGWNQSELARRAFGEICSKNTGRMIPKNKDIISKCEKGRSWPEQHNLKKIAEALGKTPEELAPDITASAIERLNPALSMTQIAGHADKVHLKVNQLVPLDAATQIITILARLRSRDPETEIERLEAELEQLRAALVDCEKVRDEWCACCATLARGEQRAEAAL
jgi:transcriptional regulator with XRE-family HTH domain